MRRYDYALAVSPEQLVGALLFGNLASVAGQVLVQYSRSNIAREKRSTHVVHTQTHTHARAHTH